MPLKSIAHLLTVLFKTTAAANEGDTTNNNEKSETNRKTIITTIPVVKENYCHAPDETVCIDDYHDSNKESQQQRKTAFSISTFNPTQTLQSLWNATNFTTHKNREASENSSLLIQHMWIAHREQLKYWQNQPSQFDHFSACDKKDYEVLETVGTGTFGRVRLVRHRGSKKCFAMKVLNKTDIVKLRQVEHINSERQVLSEVNFPFIVKLYSTFQDHSDLFMLQEYVVGGELFRHLRKATKFDNDTARFYAAQIILAIEYLHSKHIVYRDLKPENILLDQHGYIKLTDFGFAKKVKDRTWTLCGTPEYLAPEIIQSKGHSTSVDWWSLGILIYEMLAGYPPFYDDNHFGIYERILSGKIHYPSHFSSAAKDLIKNLLTINWTKRLGSLKGGASDIKQHKWFLTEKTPLNWAAVLSKTIKAPILPSCLSEEDTSNFEKYPDSETSSNIAIVHNEEADPYRELFEDF